MFLGAKVFTELPLELCKIKNYKEFKKQLTHHFNDTFSVSKSVFLLYKINLYM